MSLGQMLDGVNPDLVPSDLAMHEDLPWAFGAWDMLERMHAAMPNPRRAYACMAYTHVMAADKPAM